MRKRKNQPKRDKGLWEPERSQFPYRCYGGLPLKLMKPPALMVHQLRILVFLRDLNRPATAQEIANHLGIHLTRIRRVLGTAVRERNWWKERWEKDHQISLIDRGYVRVEYRRTKHLYYELTEVGRLVANEIEESLIPSRDPNPRKKDNRRLCPLQREFLSEELIDLQEEAGSVGHPIVLAWSNIPVEWSEYSQQQTYESRMNEQIERDEFRKLGIELTEE